MVCMCAGLHHSVEAWRKPFNPILGETWQATMPGGLCLYMEQVSCNGTGYGVAIRCAGPTRCNWSWMMSNHERQAATDVLFFQIPVAPGVK
jgi:hypothetical protein